MRGNEVLDSRDNATVACGVMLFVNVTATRAFSPATGALLPRVANPEPQLAVVCLRCEVASKESYNNYFVTIIQRGGWSLGRADPAAEVDCSSEMASRRDNPPELRGCCDVVWCHPKVLAANNETLPLSHGRVHES